MSKSVSSAHTNKMKFDQRKSKDIRAKERQQLLTMGAKERRAHLEVQLNEVNQRLDVNNMSITGQGTKGLLTLPPEIRQQIYDLVFSNKRGVITIAASRPRIRYHYARLHQVCRFLRDEVNAYYWTNECFFFETGAALELWITKHRDRIRLMNNIQIHASRLPLIKAHRNYFRNLKSLILIQPKTNSWDLRISGLVEWTGYFKGAAQRQGYWQEYNRDLAETKDNVCPVSSTLLSWRNVEIVVRSLPQFRHGQAMRDMGSVRFTVASRSVEVMPEDRWRLINIGIISKNLDLAVERIRNSARAQDMPKNISNFCRIQLGRSMW